MNMSIIVEEKESQKGMRLGIATLNAVDKHNALTLEMARTLSHQLNIWANDPEVALVVLQGAGDKAFCAGANLHRLYDSMRANVSDNPWQNEYACEFFEAEYRLDYQIHSYPKPVLCWGQGIVMGGGAGLLMGSSHRVVSTNVCVAMPETAIGLFPDVGGSHVLSGMPGRTGLFLALTGARIGASDAAYAGLAEYQLYPSDWPKLVESLLDQPWAGHITHYTRKSTSEAVEPRSINDGLLRQAIVALEPKQTLPPGPLQQHAFLINNLCNGNSLTEIYEDLLSLSDHEDVWLNEAAEKLRYSSPGSARLAFTLQQHSRLMSLADVFRMEYTAALACLVHGDFMEGIRALIIDKDKNPKWQPNHLQDATKEWVKKFFKMPDTDKRSHPLADLDAK